MSVGKIFSRNDIKYYYIGEYVLKWILIFDIMFASLFDVWLQTVIYHLYVPMDSTSVFNRLSVSGRVSASRIDGLQSYLFGFAVYDAIVIGFINGGDRIMINALLNCCNDLRMKACSH